MNSKALMSAPLLVLSFIFLDLSGMDRASIEARKQRMRQPYLVIQEQKRQAAAAAAALEQEQRNAEILRQQAAQEHQRLAAVEAERQRIAAEHNQKCQETEDIKRKLIEEEEELKKTQRKAEKAEKANRRMLEAQEQARRQEEQERMSRKVDCCKFLRGMELLIQQSEPNTILLPKNGCMISRQKGSSKKIIITTDMSNATVCATSSCLKEAMLWNLCDRLMDEMGLTGTLLELYQSVPSFPDNFIMPQFEKVNDIIKNGGLSLEDKLIYLKEYIKLGRPLSIYENDHIKTKKAKWLYYSLYMILYAYKNDSLVNSHESSERETMCCFCCDIL